MNPSAELAALHAALAAASGLSPDFKHPAQAYVDAIIAAVVRAQLVDALGVRESEAPCKASEDC